MRSAVDWHGTIASSADRHMAKTFHGIGGNLVSSKSGLVELLRLMGAQVFLLSGKSIFD